MLVICSGSNVKGNYIPCGRLVAVRCDKCNYRQAIKTAITVSILSLDWMRQWRHKRCGGGTFVPLEGEPMVSHGSCPVCHAAMVKEAEEMISA